MEEYDNNKDITRVTDALRRKEPVLDDPEALTDEIMQRIRMASSERQRTDEKPAIFILKRLLAAASVCLFMVFAYEQYIVVDKIGRLERQNAAISQNKKYRTAIKINEIAALLKSDPKYFTHYNKIKNDEASRSKMLKAVIFYELLMIKEQDSSNKIPSK